jgi:hypothetical protein
MLGEGSRSNPYREDLFQKIINVQWKKQPGSVFVMGDSGAFACYLQNNIDGTLDKTELGALSGFEGQSVYQGSIWGSSYWNVGADADGKNGTPTFIMIGDDDAIQDGGTLTSNGVIMTSNDGRSWRTTHKQRPRALDDSEHARGGCNMLAVVWDPDAHSFFAEVHESYIYHSGNGSEVYWEETNILLASSDGHGWGEVGRFVRVELQLDADGNTLREDPPMDPKNGLIQPHCSPRVSDGEGARAPDGMYGYYKDPKPGNEVLVYGDALPAVNYNGGISFANPPASSLTVEITRDDVPSTQTLTPPIPVQVCAFSNWTIAVAGGPIKPGDDPSGPSQYAVVTSHDQGKTWGEWKVGSYSGWPPAITISSASLVEVRVITGQQG